MQYIYTVQIEDKDGISKETRAGNTAACRALVSARPYPKEVRITIFHEGREVAYKEFGKTRIVWDYNG